MFDIQDRRYFRTVGAFDIVGSDMALGGVVGKEILGMVLEFVVKVKEVEQGFDISKFSLKARFPSLPLSLSFSYFPLFPQLGQFCW